MHNFCVYGCFMQVVVTFCQRRKPKSLYTCSDNAGNALLAPRFSRPPESIFLAFWSLWKRKSGIARFERRRCIPRCQIKTLLCYIGGIPPMRVTSGGTHLRGLAPGQHSSEETSQRRRAADDALSNLTDPEIKPQIIFRANSDVFNHYANLSFCKL